MDGSKSQELDFNDITEEYLCQKTISDKKLAAFAAIPENEKLIVEVNLEIKERAEAVSRTWKYLGQLLERFQNEALEVWFTADEEKRSQILQRIMPTMPASHRPDLKALYEHINGIPSVGASSRGHYLWPQLNLEDLTSNPNFLIDLLLNRSQHEPYKFAQTDARNLFSVLLDQNSYGKIVVGDESEYSEGHKNNRARFGRGIGVYEGLCVMEVQQGLLEFLVGYCRAVVLGMTHSTEWDILATPLRRKWPKTGMDAISSKFYGAPEIPTDFTKVKSMFRARLALAEDHLWLLRVNPGYFEQFVADNKLRMFGSRELIDAFASLEEWDFYLKLATEAERLQKKYAATLSPEEEMPQDYLEVIRLLDYELKKTEDNTFNQILNANDLSSSLKNFRSNLVDGNKDQEPERIIFLRSKMVSDMRLTWFSDFIDELERRVMEEGSRGTKISAYGKTRPAGWIRGYSDVGLFGIAIDELSKYQPWISQIRTMRQGETNLLNKTVPDERGTRSRYRDFFRNSDLFRKFGYPESSSFNYPVENKRSEDNIKRLRRAELDLDSFWKNTDELLMACGLPNILRGVDSEGMFWKLQAPIMTTKVSDVTMPKRFLSADNLNTRPPNFLLAESIPYVMLVSERAMKVFSTIFQGTTLGVDANKIKIHFREFIGAMEEVGFRATKHHISIWHFEPEGVPLWANPALAHGIMIYEPWPNQRISFKYALELGQRLHRRYEWNIDMFTAKYNPDTHWIARFDDVQFLHGEEITAAQELGISMFEVDMRNQQIERLQAEAGGYFVERKIKDQPIWFGDILCERSAKEVYAARLLNQEEKDNEVGQSSE
ncbi:hypothetical protein NHQ30_000909 [Ciborinia camelliae]|nr:hypothetical protein NHQ30_000909 [Ciborinia camelliae]